MKTKTLELLRNLQHRLSHNIRGLFVAVIALCLIPLNTRADGIGDILSLFHTITSTLQGPIGGALSEMRKGECRSEQFSPADHLAFGPDQPDEIAQLLEQSLLSGNPGAMPQITSNYSALYGTVMPSANAPQSVRNMVDMTDAGAQAAMKKAVEIDALANLELQAAEQINQQLQTATPGSSTILESETAAWLVRANAYTQSAMAELVRVRSIELANSSGQLKFSASHASTLHTTGNQVLQPGVQ